MLQVKNFDLSILENSDYNIMVFSTSYETPFACLDEITDNLKQNGHRDSKVIFDLLLSIGNTRERFVEAYFNGESFVESSFKYVSVNKKSIIRLNSRDFYSERVFMLQNSVLNSAQKKLLSKGVCI